MKKFLPPQLVLVCLPVMFLLHWFFPGLTFLPVPFQLVGLFPLFAGLVLTIAASGQFQRVGTNVKTFNEPGKLVTDGWFRFTRNPMYLGFLLVLLGVGTLFGTASPLLGPLAFGIIANLWYIPFEEQAMSAKFGPAYKAYQQRVWRWL
jgi:protein-S-isoprenylcysteine O-methyltransferase Ste14